MPTPLNPWLRRLNQPWIWCSSLALVLLGIILHQYTQNPEWVGSFGTSDDASQLDGQAAQLTPQEQALLADVDTSSSLLNGFGITADEAPPEDSLLGLLQEATPPEEAANPFAAYVEQYSFTPAPEAADTLTLEPPELAALMPAIPEAQPVNPLRQALQRDSPAAVAEASAQPALSPQPLLPGQLGIVPGTLPGSDRRFILTTPQMSPPPGTTGYTPPASLNFAPATPGSQALPTPAPITPDFTVPTPQSRSNPYGLPSGSGVSGATTAPPVSGYTDPGYEVPQYEPFTVPRPPGSYTGGGYINTFSDPAGPVD